MIDRARAALARAETLADIGAIIEIAERGRRYAKAAQLGLDAENYAAALRLEAEREAGKWLANPEAERQIRGGDRRSKSQNGTLILPPKLSELAITKRQSSDWQAVASVPDPVFREHVAKAKTTKRALTTAGLVEIARKIARTARRAEAKPVVTLTRSDARVEEVDVTRGLPLEDETVDLIVTSPPYGLDIDYDHGDVGASLWVAFMEGWLLQALRVVKPSGRLALNIPLDTSEPTYRPTAASSRSTAPG